MKALLVGINAQYMHTCLAVRCLAGYARHRLEGRDLSLSIAEYTINQPVSHILEKLALAEADAYFFSCYIWNIDVVLSLAHELRKLLPGALLVMGGPQVGFAPEKVLQACTALDVVLCGEGEVVFTGLLRALCEGEINAAPNKVIAAGTGQLPAMDDLPFCYSADEIRSGRTLYYESMRGCPFGCSYCASGGVGGVRYKSLGKVFEELGRFYAAAGTNGEGGGVEGRDNVRRPVRLKFVDRTFNCDAARALAIWKWLAQHDNGRVNFHFELAGHLLDEESLDFLAGVRPGLFQFEIGVQSTCRETLNEIGRCWDAKRLAENIRRLREAGNIHLHLDLIAGLPREDAVRFEQSFNEVYAMRPHQLQLGFLKVLSGSEMETKAPQYGLCWQDVPPFEIIYNKWMTFKELAHLKKVAGMVELYYNSGRFARVCGWLQGWFATPFAFYEALAEEREGLGGEAAPLGKSAQYELLGRVAEGVGALDDKLAWLCRLDMATHEKPRVQPAWVRVDGSKPHYRRVLAFYENAENVAAHLPEYAGLHPKQLMKQAHVEVLPFDPESGEDGECAFLFNYRRPDVTGLAACQRIDLPKGEEG